MFADGSPMFRFRATFGCHGVAHHARSRPDSRRQGPGAIRPGPGWGTLTKAAKKPSQSPTASRSALLIRLDNALDTYPGALARAAQYVVENPEKVVHQSLAELSDFAKVGQASVIRLCRELGFDGFTPFKIALSADLAVRNSGDVAANGGASDPLSRTADLLCASINETRQLLDDEALSRIADRLARSVRVDLFGMGVSGMIGELIGYRLLRLGFHANAMRDAVLAHEVSNGLGPKATTIAISQSGSTPDTVQFLKHAHDAGAFTVAVTCHPKSALAKVADETLTMARLQEPTYGGPITDVPRAVLIAEAIALSLQ